MNESPPTPKNSRVLILTVWAHVLAVCIAVFGFYNMGGIFSNILTYYFRGKYGHLPWYPFPTITTWYIYGCGWAWLLLPVFVGTAIWLIRKRKLTVESVLAFSAASILTIVVLAVFAALAASVPYVKWIPNFGSPYWPK